MEYSRTSLPPLAEPGQLATFYALDSGTERSAVLANSALLLAGRARATLPVLMIDWDTESPALHQLFEQEGEHAGVLELFEACRDCLAGIGPEPGADPAALAQQVLASVDWRAYVQRVDHSRPLYLMRAGNFSADYAQRAASMDWDGLFAICPALFRSFAAQLCAHFRHVLVDARSGRSACVSICTTLLPHKLVALFGPSQRSLDGIHGAVMRAIDYRCSHEEEQRPLLVYPVPLAVDVGDSERRALWRRGDARHAVAGYQPVLERLLRQCYGRTQVSLDSYLDEVQLQAMGGFGWGARLAVRHEHGGDRFSLTRSIEALLAWVEEGHFPWQSRAELDLLASVGAPAQGAAAAGAALARLGQLYGRNGAPAQAIARWHECVDARARALGEQHADTIDGRIGLAEALRQDVRLAEARLAYEMLQDTCAQALAPDHPHTLRARAGLAATLAQQGQHETALAIQEDVLRRCEQSHGAAHPATCEHLAAHAALLVLAGEAGRARAALERVLELRRQLLGGEHEDTLDCMHELALLLRHGGELAQARQLLECVVGARERHGGADHGASLRAHEALAATLAEQGQFDAASTRHEALARARARSLGADHPDTLATQLRLASVLDRQGDVAAARRLQNHVMRLHGSAREGMLGAACGAGHAPGHELAAGPAPLNGPPWRDAGSAALGQVEESLRQASERLRSFTHAARARAGAPPPPETEHLAALEGKISQVQRLIASEQLEQARDLADSLRKPLLRPGIAPALRRRGMAVLKIMYKMQGDKDALAALDAAEARVAGASLGNVQLAGQ
ncbi:MAG: tetratricopeptide repeat protein [Pseudomonadota bacterium]